MVGRGISCGVLAALIIAGAADACTIFHAFDGELALGGNNEDWKDPNTIMWLVPAGEGEHGRAYFGFLSRWPQGGVNDQGLFFDGAATAPLELKRRRDGAKPFRGDLLDRVMRECATVEEAVAMLDEHQLPFMDRAMLMFGDRHGASAIYEGDDVLYKPPGARHQVVTNFYQSRQTADEAGCWRYQAAQRVFADRLGLDARLTVDLARAVLDATHQEGRFATRYSNIYDLTNNVIYLYRNHDFETVVTLDLAGELAKGERTVRLASLFEADPDTRVEIARRTGQWNEQCPKSGRPVIEDAYFEHDGIRVHFCNEGCAVDGAKDPEYWIARAYAEPVATR